MAYALGRIVHHDPRSLDHPAPRGPVRTAFHRHVGPALDQGELGSCTGNAMAQVLMTEPLVRPGRTLVEADAVALYHAATLLDDVPGAYPPDDTGSSGLAVAKAAQRAGYISAYQHAFGIDHARQAIGASPFIVGTDWYEAMFTPAADGTVAIGGEVAGGHEYLCLGVDVEAGRWLFLNSWGPAWGVVAPQAGVEGGGAFWMADATFARLLAADGDVTVPVP